MEALTFNRLIGYSCGRRSSASSREDAPGTGSGFVLVIRVYAGFTPSLNTSSRQGAGGAGMAKAGTAGKVVQLYRV